ncbi:MAG: type II secretion system F family protein [Clostridia bacterium]|jgi:tight adherence protein B
MIVTGLIMVFTSIFLCTIGLGMLVTSRRRTIVRRLSQYSEFYSEGILTEDGEQGIRTPVQSHDRNTTAGGLQRYFNKIETEMAKADLLLHPKEYLSIVAILSVSIGLILYTVTRQISIGLMGILIGMILSRIFVNLKKGQRVMKLNHQLVDAITLISNGLKAGYSFFQAAELVAQDMRPPIADEFRKMIRQMNLGMPAEEALRRLGERVESEDMDLVITAILIQRQVGGNLAEVLDSITNTIRERVKIKGEIKSKTAQGRISGLILVFLPPALAFIIYIMSPTFMNALFTDPLGWLMIGIAVLLQVLGIIFILRIINIEV